MNQFQPSADRLWELLADRATGGLTAGELAELNQLLLLFPEVDAEEFDRLAAMVDLSLPTAHLPAAHEPLPQQLRAQIKQSFAARSDSNGFTDGVFGEVVLPVQLANKSVPILAWTGWLAAAAALLVAAMIWSTGQPGIAPSAEVARRALLEMSDTIETPLAAPDAAPGVTGDVVWNEREQRGYMRLKGLAVNDPALRQYQLWIFDKNQDERYPIDGGVFDVGRDGEVIVPIHAAIRVADPTMYAITVEKPGGVVVSSRDQIVLLGKVAG